MTGATATVNTRERILDAAERLFSEHGLDGTSLRMITTEAQVNLAAVNYHFRSKEALIQEVFARRLGPINQRRLEMLDELEARAGSEPVPLEDVLIAFLEPALRMRRHFAETGFHLPRLMGRMYGEPVERLRPVFQEQFGELAARFSAALRRALPQLSERELLWRIHFVIGAMAHTMAGVGFMTLVTGEPYDASDVEGSLERLVAFCAAGLRAPATPREPARN